MHRIVESPSGFPFIAGFRFNYDRLILGSTITSNKERHNRPIDSD
jgi:hypothetical protein